MPPAGSQPYPPQGQPYPGPGQPQGQPYPGTPPQGQAYPGTPPQGMPQPGPGGPGGPVGPGGQPLPPPPPPYQPKKRGVFARIGIYIVGLVVVGVGIFAFNYFTSDAAQAKAGDCANVTGTTSEPNFKTVACDSPEANYVIGKTLKTSESCPGKESYDEYIETQRRGPSTKLCLMPKLEQGACYPDTKTNAMGYPKGTCKAGEIKVSKVVTGKADEAACPSGETSGALTFPEPPTTYCIEAVQ
jgi:hypothetical protein